MADRVLLGPLGIAIARELRDSVVHTYHTQYEDYVRYIAKGRSSVQVWLSTLFVALWAIWMGLSVRAEIVYDLYSSTRLLLKTGHSNRHWTWKSQRPELTEEDVADLESQAWYFFGWNHVVELVPLYEKISKKAMALPSVLEEDDKVWLVVAGDGPTYQTWSLKPRNLVFWIRWFSGMIAPAKQLLL